MCTLVSSLCNKTASIATLLGWLNEELRNKKIKNCIPNSIFFRLVHDNDIGILCYCYTLILLPAPGMSTEEEALIQLKRIFPDHDSEQLKSILRTALSLNDAIDIVLDDKVDLPKSINISPSQDQASSLQKFFSTNALITHFQKDIEEVMKLNIDRVELWRMALSFYKKSMKNPHELKKALEVCW